MRIQTHTNYLIWQILYKIQDLILVNICQLGKLSELTVGSWVSFDQLYVFLLEINAKNKEAAKAYIINLWFAPRHDFYLGEKFYSNSLHVDL